MPLAHLPEIDLVPLAHLPENNLVHLAHLQENKWVHPAHPPEYKWVLLPHPPENIKECHKHFHRIIWFNYSKSIKRPGYRVQGTFTIR